MNKLVVHPEARSEMGSAIRWYEAQREGLGGDFNDAVEAVFALIESNPRRGWLYGKKGYRVLPTARFPYLVYYIERDDAVKVTAISHEHRQPDYWQHRADD